MPITKDATLQKIKHEVLYQVAKYAYEGTLEENRDQIPFEMIPGPHAAFRCCIYREREIIRQRIRLAEGKPAGVQDTGNLIQVINSACEGCPITKYIVTDNCQKCMSRACQQACRFGAISMGRDKSYIDPSKCKECGQCSRACPYNAIAELTRPCIKSCPVGAISVEDNGTGIAKINNDKCIRCGQCIHKCPFGAIGSKTFIVEIINQIRAGREVYAMIAPASVGQFGPDITMSSWRTALKKIGFTDLWEVALGGDLTAHAEAEEWLEAKRKDPEARRTTSCCPAFKLAIQKHFPELQDMISDTVSPMCGVSRLIKREHPGAITVFIGPCIAKKEETLMGIEGNADFALTFGEIRAMLRAKEVVLEPEPEERQDSSVFGKRFANAGGVAASVLEVIREKGAEGEIQPEDVLHVDGYDEIKKNLLLLKAGRLPQHFIEGMVCTGGCVGGPSSHRSAMQSRKDREALLSAVPKDLGVTGSVRNAGADDLAMHGNSCCCGACKAESGEDAE